MEKALNNMGPYIVLHDPNGGSWEIAQLRRPLAQFQPGQTVNATIPINTANDQVVIMGRKGIYKLKTDGIERLDEEKQNKVTLRELLDRI